MNPTNSKVFNPNDHLIQIKSGQTSKDYLPVQWRLVWFRSIFPQGTIHTELVLLDLDRDTEEEIWVWNAEKKRNEKVIKQAKGLCVYKATVTDGQGGIAMGTKSEKAASFSDFIEKSETGAIGRALAALGYGTQFAPELDEEHRIVDAPVGGGSNAGHSSGHSNSGNVTPMRPAKDPVAELARLLTKAQNMNLISKDGGQEEKFWTDFVKMNVDPAAPMHNGADLTPAEITKIDKYIDAKKIEMNQIAAAKRRA